MAKQLSLAFNEKFDRIFNLASRPYEEQMFAKYALSNLLGGIIYLHGSTYFSDGDKIVETSPVSLLTDTPSRLAFPRGFLWDTGFHNLIVQKWDIQLALQILQSWLSLMDGDGWIGREQVPGGEARERVPDNLWIQNPKYANPPGLFLALESLLVENKTNNQVAAFLEANYAKFALNYAWYFKTQSAVNHPRGFKWQGRTDHHTLTSGLDDYPRAPSPDPNEMHVDLASWMAMASRVMCRYADWMGKPEEAFEYNQRFIDLVGVIEEYHWDDEEGLYTDISLDENNQITRHTHFGYVSLFPLLFSIAGTDRAHKLTKKIEIELLTDYGVRSLTPKSPYYMSGDQYWTGPIWININYMLIKALGEYKMLDLKDRIKNNLINNMVDQFTSKGTIYEQYSDTTGQCQRSPLFTGWSSLALLIMQM